MCFAAFTSLKTNTGMSNKDKDEVGIMFIYTYKGFSLFSSNSPRFCVGAKNE